MKNKRILYMGTTAFAAYILEELIKNDYQIIGVVSQPDRQIGRKKEVKQTPTKEVALKHQIEVYGFENINEHFDVISDLKPDLIITCAYGQKISVAILNLPPYRSINVHASLLPKYRGGAPIHYAIINGDKITGNTIIYMEEALDSGDILNVSQMPIDIKDTYDTLAQKLMIDGAKLLDETLPRIFNKEIQPIPQDESQVVFAPVIKRADEFIDFNRDTLSVYNHIRGLISVPGPYAILDKKKIKFFAVGHQLEKVNEAIGQVVIDSKEYFKIACRDGYILVYQFQLEGKKPIMFKDYLHGNKLEISDEVIINKGV